MRKLGVGVLGVGEMGRRHAENLRRLVPQAQLVAVADVAPGARASDRHRTRDRESFGSLEAMLECKGLDAVVITTPDKFHAEAVKTIALCWQGHSLRKAACADAWLTRTTCWRRLLKPAFACRWDSCGATILPMPQR